ncbi:MAG TPA: 4'-phosphopantetheinyl transferase superfamily protein [Longimicrobiales bacterium]
MSESEAPSTPWEQPPSELVLTPGVVHAWLLSDDAMLAAAGRRDVLARDEADRAARLEGARSRAFIATRVTLRILLARYTSDSPEGILFDYGPLGKPRLRTGDIQFSISHAGDRALLAFSRTAPVGVDVERVRSARRFDALTARFLSADNARIVGRATASARPRIFAEAWAQREAYVKAVGGGLYATPDLLPFLPGRVPVREVLIDGTLWSVAALDAGDEYEARLVTAARVSALRTFSTRSL